jgi:hypothetical protein
MGWVVVKVAIMVAILIGVTVLVTSLVKITMNMLVTTWLTISRREFRVSTWGLIRIRQTYRRICIWVNIVGPVWMQTLGRRGGGVNPNHQLLGLHQFWAYQQYL